MGPGDDLVCHGTITDDSNKELLVGATVVAKHLPTGTTYGAVTNAKGNFSIVGMRPGGPYTLTVSYIGFESITLSNIHLALGEAETFNIKMKDGATPAHGRRRHRAEGKQLQPPEDWCRIELLSP